MQGIHALKKSFKGKFNLNGHDKALERGSDFPCTLELVQKASVQNVEGSAH